MNIITYLSLILNYSPLVVLPVIFLLAVIFFWKRRNFFFLIWIMIGFHLGLALVKSILQYLVWNSGGITQSLLNLPLKKLDFGWFENLPIFTDFSHGYFVYYIWNHFWKEAILSIAAAIGVYIIFLLLRKYKSRLISIHESELGFLFCLLVGWPQIILFLPLVLFLSVVYSILNWFYKREAFCSLFLPFAVSAGIMLVFSAQLQALRFMLVNF
jgi:hypothetical protein